MEPLAAKWEAFGWRVARVDGHDMAALAAVLDPRRNETDGAPRMIIADTVKGKGVSFMENVRSWHADTITEDQYARVMAELRELAP
jgi:transketolase